MKKASINEALAYTRADAGRGEFCRPRRKFVRGVLQHNAHCLDALRRGLERGQLQFGEFLARWNRFRGDTDFASRLGEAARLHLVRLPAVDSPKATSPRPPKRLFRLEKIGSMICGGEGQMLHYLIGLWLPPRPCGASRAWLPTFQRRRPSWSGSLAMLNEGLKTPDGLIQSLRIDVCRSPSPNWTAPWKALTWKRSWRSCWRFTMFPATGWQRPTAPSVRPLPTAGRKSAPADPAAAGRSSPATGQSGHRTADGGSSPKRFAI